MDLVNYDEDAYRKIVAEFKSFSSRLDIKDITFIPISALKGDNVVDSSKNMSWYGGSTLLHHIENVHVGADRNLQDCRFPFSTWFAHKLMITEISEVTLEESHLEYYQKGDAVVALPSGRETTIDTIKLGDEEKEIAFPPLSVVNDID